MTDKNEAPTAEPAAEAPEQAPETTPPSEPEHEPGAEGQEPEASEQPADGGGDQEPESQDSDLTGLAPSIEGSKLEPDDVAAVLEWAQEAGLTRDGAQLALDREASLHLEALNAFEAERAGWEKALKEDPDFGGDSYDENQKRVDALILKFGDKEFAEYLDRTGGRNFPPLVKMLHRMVGREPTGHVNPGDSTGENRPKRDMFANSRKSMQEAAKRNGY